MAFGERAGSTCPLFFLNGRLIAARHLWLYAFLLGRGIKAFVGREYGAEWGGRLVEYE